MTADPTADALNAATEGHADQFYEQNKCDEHHKLSFDTPKGRRTFEGKSQSEVMAKLCEAIAELDQPRITMQMLGDSKGRMTENGYEIERIEYIYPNQRDTDWIKETSIVQGLGVSREWLREQFPDAETYAQVVFIVSLLQLNGEKAIAQEKKEHDFTKHQVDFLHRCIKKAPMLSGHILANGRIRAKFADEYSKWMQSITDGLQQFITPKSEKKK